MIASYDRNQHRNVAGQDRTQPSNEVLRRLLDYSMLSSHGSRETSLVTGLVVLQFKALSFE